MDGNFEYKRGNTLFAKLASSIWNLFPKNKSSMDISCPESIDLDESQNDDLQIPITGLETLNDSKIKYRETILKELKNEQRKRVLEPTNRPENSIKRVKLNSTVSSCAIQNEKFVDAESVKPTFSYKVMCNALNNRVIRGSQCNNLSNANSVQSLTESLDGSCHGIIASRLYANIRSRKLVPTSCDDDNILSSEKHYFMDNRRFKTIVKKDNVSSYLFRESISPGNSFFTSVSPSVYNASNNDEESLRFDFTRLRNTGPDSIVNSRKAEGWMCAQCDANNPLYYNFCPSCAGANPFNDIQTQSSNISPNQRAAQVTWKCTSCSTDNNIDRTACVCCFMVKNKSTLSIDLTSTKETEFLTPRVNLQCQSRKNEQLNFGDINKSNRPNFNAAHSTVAIGADINNLVSKSNDVFSWIKLGSSQEIEPTNSSNFGSKERSTSDHGREDAQIKLSSSVRNLEYSPRMIEQCHSSPSDFSASAKSLGYSSRVTEPSHYFSINSSNSEKLAITTNTKELQHRGIFGPRFTEQTINSSVQGNYVEHTPTKSKWRCSSCGTENIVERVFCICGNSEHTNDRSSSIESSTNINQFHNVIGGYSDTNNFGYQNDIRQSSTNKTVSIGNALIASGIDICTVLTDTNSKSKEMMSLDTSNSHYSARLDKECNEPERIMVSGRGGNVLPAQEKMEDLNFSFCSPDLVPFVCKGELGGDIEFVFSPAAAM